MKRIAKKIIIIMVLTLMMINSSFLMIISNAIEESKSSQKEMKPIIEMDLEKYVNYVIGDTQKGLLLQTNIKTGIEYGENEERQAINWSGIEICAPQIEGEYPESVEVIGRSTKATNGSDTAKDFEFAYDKQTGKVQILVLNREDGDGNLYIGDDGERDEYTVIYNYNENCYAENTERNLELKANIKESITGENVTTIESEIQNTYAVKENISELLATKVETSEIYNGYIKSNQENGTNYRTEYTEKVKLQVSYKEIADEINIDSNYNFIKETEEVVETEDIIYTKTKVNKNDLLDKLGEDGYLQILNANGEVLGQVNRDSETTEDGMVEIYYENEPTKLTIKLSKPEKVGDIDIENTKQIKEGMKDTSNQKIQINQTINCINKVEKKQEGTEETVIEEQKVYQFSSSNTLEIKDAETRVDLSIDKTELTNSIQNDVILTATLVTNENRYNLFKNPVIEIELPSEVEKIILGDVSLFYENNLSIKSAEVVDKNGVKVIRVELQGKQNEYLINSMIRGTNVLIPATIILKKDIQSCDSNIKLTYTNENEGINDYAKEGKTGKEVGISIKSMIEEAALEPVAMVASAPATQENLNDAISVETKIQVGTQELKEGDIVYEQEVMNYIILIKNNSSNDIENINIQSNIPEGTTYVTKDGGWIYSDNGGEESRKPLYTSENKEEVIQKIEKIKASESYSFTYKLRIDNLENNQEREINNTINVLKNDENIYSETVNLIAKSAKLKVEIYPKDDEFNFNTKNNWMFEIHVTNLTTEKLTNVTIESELEKELRFLSAAGIEGLNPEYDENKRLLKVNIGELNAEESKMIAVRVTASNYEENKYEYYVYFTASTFADNTDKYRADGETNIAYAPGIKIIQESATEAEDLSSDQEIEYNFTISNVGMENTVINVIDNLPEGLIPVEANYEIYEYNDQDKQYNKVTKQKDMTYKVGDDDFKIETWIPKEGSINIKLKAQVDRIDSILEIENVAVVSGIEITDKVSNSIKNRILPWQQEQQETDKGDGEEDSDNKPDSDSENEDNNQEQDQEQVNVNISGMVWLDSNKDGKRDNEEERISGITVKLYNATTSKIETDESGNKQIKTTNQNGEYTFSEVKKGKYLVLFEYNTNEYSLTKYQAVGVNSQLNSDVALKSVSIDGEEKEVGLTDIIDVTSSNKENIDMGLIKNEIFDFKLDKYISKVSVTNAKGTKEYNYNNSSLAKIEIGSKEIEGTEVKVEYKIVVTNEGETSGYITEIVDYLPEGLQFDKSTNSQWSTTGNGSIVNKSLAGQKIDPGETKEVTVILNKKMSEDNTGRILNAAEIKSTYNANNRKDIDSTEFNKNRDEDDYSEAELIISIKTGLIKNILIFIIIAIILLLIVYGIKNKKINKLFMFSFIAMITISAVTIVNAEGPWYEENLGFHYTANGWEQMNAGQNLWCLTPGKHLGKSSNCVGHYYTKSSDSPFAVNSQAELDNFFVVRGLGSYYGFTFGTTSTGTLSANKETTTISYKYSNSGNKIIVGPFKLQYTASNCTGSVNVKLTVKNGRN